MLAPLVSDARPLAVAEAMSTSAARSSRLVTVPMLPSRATSRTVPAVMSTLSVPTLPSVMPVDEVMATATPLPDGFPLQEELAAAGLLTIEDVRAEVDLAGLPGIGETNAAEIVQALAELE